MAGSIGNKGKFNSAFSVGCYRVALLRHVALNEKLIMPSKTGSGDDVARVMMVYVIFFI